MLVFRRKVGDAVVLNGEIEVQVLEISGSRVKLGFSAPGDVTILRKELYLTQEENRRAAASVGAGELSLLAQALRRDAPPRQDNSSNPDAGPR
jgi:carbon storage regulator